MHMLNGIGIYSSDSVWRHILGDLGARVTDVPTMADLNFDAMNITPPLTVTELKSIILGATDNSRIMGAVFGRDVRLPRLQMQIVVWLYKTGGMSGGDLRAALGYAPGVATHAVDTAIYQLRRTFGRDFIKNNNGIYSIGTI